MTLTGKDLIAMGYESGSWFAQAIAEANARNLQGGDLRHYLDRMAPPRKRPLLAEPAPVDWHLEAEGEDDAENVAAVRRTMDALMRTPTLVGGAVMPDACPAGPEGTIPVGGVAIARNAIHPGMHSADICCSVMMTEFHDVAPKDVLDTIHAVTHFGPGGRGNGERFTLSPKLLDAFRDNMFLKDAKIVQAAMEHLGTQGDGNHFAFVGVSSATGRTCLLTHHGSRGPGAGLYKLGMRHAEKMRRKLSPETAKGNAWIPADSPQGEAYWEALQLIRKWTKANHNGLHQAVVERLRARIERRVWNEHNFVFRKGDLYYHAKGATPVDEAFLPDSGGVQIVPLNMAQPILLVRRAEGAPDHGFAPHGAGRNMSRTAHKRRIGDRPDTEVFAEETAGIDARFYCGRIDVSELPSAYKDAGTVRRQMAAHRLADVVDEILPHGAIMAGDWEHDAPWKVKARAKWAAREAAS
ncbi:RtcB family protein [Roseobacter sp. HKCCA0434]|uniref:RtcB family protein n=1 Tax=Roseobacter sp. HKCCA0434 TaxID=3079297 RepID=UPI002905F335|nr:RtcB family protein [Roseobacter sp. HKCCA0434]